MTEFRLVTFTEHCYIGVTELSLSFSKNKFFFALLVLYVIMTFIMVSLLVAESEDLETSCRCTLLQDKWPKLA